MGRSVCIRRRRHSGIEGGALTHLYIGLIVVFTALVVPFQFQNLGNATISLFSASITLPLSTLVLAIYVPGMLTGGFLLALLRTWIGRARQAA
jgi:putative membrane protein